jgi:beta-barrel assembly-enhancing protease
MRLFRPPAYFATLCLVVSLASVSFSSAALARKRISGRENPRAEVYRANLLTPDEERIVGQRLAYLYEQRHQPLKDGPTQARLERIQTRLRPSTGGQTLKIRIIQGKRPEAVSFPQGNIYITTALIKLTENDDELAAVIAHEAAHVACRHLARLIALAQTLSPAERESFPTRGALLTGQSLQFAFPAALNDTRLRAEMEADRLALGWLEGAGYRTESLAALLKRLAKHLSPRERAALQSRVTSLSR